jgi:ATP synthase protein I
MPSPPDPRRERFARRIRQKEARSLRARRQKSDSLWVGIGTFGMVGWSVAIPTILGIATGLWLDANAPQSFSWTLTLMITGVILGCLNTWYWVSREQRLIRHNDHDNGDDDGHE